MEAAASIVISPGLQVIFDRLASPALQKFADIWGFRDNLQSLQQALEMVQATLEEAEEQQFTNKAVRLWLSKLKNAASDAEDLLDFINAKETIMGDGALVKFHYLIPKFVDSDRVRKMIQALEMTAIEGLLKLQFREPNRNLDHRPRLSEKRETSSFVVDSEIYGRHDDKEKLVKLLLSSQSDNYQQEGYANCIPIIGIGGIGKTTLAQLAYSDERVNQHFDVRMWVFVSDDFNVKKIMETIIGCINKDECKYLQLDQLQSELWNLLHNKRYLIVLDDVWTEDQDDWDKLRPLFRGGINGCKIIVTTRSKKIPLLMDFPSSPYYLNGLADDDCWDLFKQRAFGRGEEDKYPNLSVIGKQIVKKCGGVPLAAKSLGSLMRLKREEQQWLFVQKSELWKLDVCKYSILPALMLSYVHLPSHLRQCFAFCSVFPKSYEFKKQKLVHIWMAEGLLIPQEGNKRPEDIGDEYFADLLWMSFFQEVELCDGGDMTAYKMNDVIHDLARYVAGKESVILEHSVPVNSPAQIRHSSVVYAYGETAIPNALYKAEHLRTLLLIGESGRCLEMWSSFVYLRVLDLNSSNVTRLDVSLGGMICLRYLDLSYTPIRFLPESTSNLCSLQTLNLFGCHNLIRLPFLGRIMNLRHLNLAGCESLTNMPPGLGSLRQLQTLPLYVVGMNRGSLSMLEHLDLYGTLTITDLVNTRYAAEAKSAGLKMKENLESLGLYWGSNYEYESITRLFKARRREAVISESQIVEQQREPVEHILDSLQPHKNLKNLVINGYGGIRFAHWALPRNLVTVEFTNCKNCEHLPALGNLLLLKSLSLHGMHGVKRIGREFYGENTTIWFPSLEELSISDFPNLEEWSTENDTNAFPSLRKLTVKGCPKLDYILLPQSLQHLELRDCNPTLASTGRLSFLSVLVIEKIPKLLCLPQGFFASASLTSLQILSCPNLCSLPVEIGNLTALKSLTIRWCDELSSLPDSLRNLKALESLEIGDCHSIVSMPDDVNGGLSSLRTLSIENCNSLTCLTSSLENLRFLEHLTIMYCPNLGCFPEGVQHLSALRSLTILSCPWFDSLPEGLQNCSALHSLEISSCPNLTCLPEWFGNLASLRSLSMSDCLNLKQLSPSLKLLTKLQHLSIQECPELEERCGENGEDWLNIAHIPHKYIGPQNLRLSSEASASNSMEGSLGIDFDLARSLSMASLDAAWSGIQF